MALRVTMIAPKPGTEYTVNGRSYVSGPDFRVVVTQPEDQAALGAMGFQTDRTAGARRPAVRELTLMGTTTGAEPLTLTGDGLPAGAGNVIAMADRSALGGRLVVVGRAADGSGKSYHSLHVHFWRDDGPASAGASGGGLATLTEGTAEAWDNDADAPVWRVDVGADTENGAGIVTVRGPEGASVAWVATLHLVEYQTEDTP